MRPCQALHLSSTRHHSQIPGCPADPYLQLKGCWEHKKHTVGIAVLPELKGHTRRSKGQGEEFSLLSEHKRHCPQDWPSPWNEQAMSRQAPYGENLLIGWIISLEEIQS